MFKADSFAGAGCKKRVSRLQFNILDDSLKLCTGFGSFCKRSKFMAWASAGPAEIMNL